MLESHVEPSELHWKKELTVLRKAARVLRDPETSCSWKSPLSSRSVAAASGWDHGNGSKGNFTGSNDTIEYSESHYACRSENNQRNVSLCNWGHQSVESIGRGTNVDGDMYEREGSKAANPEYNLEVFKKKDTHTDTYQEDPIMVFRVREANPGAPVKRTVKKPKKGHAISKPSIQKSSNPNLLDFPSIAYGEVTSAQQSDDTDCCRSEDSRILRNKITQKYGYTLKSESAMPTKFENWSYPSKLLKSIRRGESSYSCTPASTSSYKYRKKNPSTVGSWDGSIASFDGYDIDHLDVTGSRGCGIPCNLAKRMPKGCGGCFSPSLSDTLRRKGSSILRGSRSLYHKNRSSQSNKRKLVSRSSQGMPLLTYNSDDRGGSSMDSGQSDNESSPNFEELELEALSRFDGTTWASSCRSQDGLELVPLAGGAEEGKLDHNRSLSQKYRPRSFSDLVGQSIVVHSLTNAIFRGRIAPLYLFQGPHGTGKTSTARILASALNCLSTIGTKPCGFCSECTHSLSSKSMDLREVDATNKKEIDRVKYLLKSLSAAPASTLSRYNVFIINKCHFLPSKIWSAFLKFLEEPLPRVVFMFITTDIDNLPHTVLSRCQKYLFNKITDADTVTRLKKISADENLDVELDALNLIALNAEGSLGDAETMLDQLTLLGKKITVSLVNELVGVVSDEKLLGLLELAMASDTVETVKRTRELMDSGVDPMALTSQLAGIIMDIIAGTYHLDNSECSSSFFAGQSLNEADLNRLKHALKLLLEAERQLRVSNERSTWFTATLLQIGSVLSSDATHSSSSRKQCSTVTEEEPSGASRRLSTNKKPDALQGRRKSTSSVSMPKPVDGRLSSTDDLLLMVDTTQVNARLPCSFLVEGCASASAHEDTAGSKECTDISADKLDNIWEICIGRCHSKTLRQLLHGHSRLLSISELEGVLTAFVAFEDGDVKYRAERFVQSITDSIESVVGHDVEVRMGLILDEEAALNGEDVAEFPDYSVWKEMGTTKMEREQEGDSDSSMNGRHSDLELHQESLKPPKESFYSSEYKLDGLSQKSASASLVVGGCYQVTSELPMTFAEKDARAYAMKEGKEEIPLQRIQSIIDEQRLESAWLQAAEKGTPGSLSRLKPERNQVLPQDAMYRPNQMASMISRELSSQKWEDELNDKIKALKFNNDRSHQYPSGTRDGNYPRSPSLLHDNSSEGKLNNEKGGYEPGTGRIACNGLFCWKMTKPNKKRKVKPGTPVYKRKNILLFGECGMTKRHAEVQNTHLHKSRF